MDADVTSPSGRPAFVPAAQYSRDDLASTIRVLGPWWFTLVEHLPDPLAVPAIAELLGEQAVVLQTLAGAVDLPPELFRIALDAEHELSVATSLMRKRWTPETQEHVVRAVDASIALLHRAGRAVMASPGAPVAARGDVAGLFVSGGGVPKQGVERVDVGPRGITGDRQKTRRHHGRAWQALCLWSADVVQRLSAEGHPIAPGHAGENISIVGLDWADVRPGVQLRIGTVLAEVSTFALPCFQNTRWFRDGDYERMHHRREAGVSRVYASVLEPGAVHVGDPVNLVP